MRALILGGTTEGRLLASACVPLAGVETITSLAGRTSTPLPIAGTVRIGGFGGVRGLVEYLRGERIDIVVDATHPFAATMTTHAVEAAGLAGVRLLRLRRPGWTEEPGDRWHRVPDMASAAKLLPRLGVRVFLTTGRQEIAVFAHLDECWFLARSVEQPEQPMPRNMLVLLDRGPFTPAGESALLAGHRIDVLVTKDSGGAAAKLVAARAAGVPVIVVDRPWTPATETVATVAEAVDRLVQAG